MLNTSLASVADSQDMSGDRGGFTRGSPISAWALPVLELAMAYGQYLD